MTPNDIYTHRVNLAEARASLRAAQDRMALIEAQLSLGVDGKNADERKARLVLTLDQSSDYRMMRQAAHDLTETIETTEAVIERFRDERRDREWAIRLRRVEALERLGLGTDDDAAADIA